MAAKTTLESLIVSDTNGPQYSLRSAVFSEKKNRYQRIGCDGIMLGFNETEIITLKSTRGSKTLTLRNTKKLLWLQLLLKEDRGKIFPKKDLNFDLNSNFHT